MQLVNAAIEQVKPDVVLKKISIETDINQNFAIFADRNMTETILRNLLSNAIKYSFENGEIIISATETDSMTAISVTDFGVGMDPEEAEMIFKIENKIRKTGTKGEKGTGLGLILCAEFVKKNGGNIFAESTKNVKTIITFTLPNQKEKREVEK
jgi:signal transduction histidine kinase